ncbi:MAG TPA: hypothetical protein VH044_04085 [Polyangiaceae bacterium]|jgi:hypothetical protein|nr:hypothetical protein [Polyangiaceae bacterium]
MERCFLSTQEPSLIARCRDLREHGEPSRSREIAGASASTAPDGPAAANRAVSTPEQLAQTAVLGRVEKLG